MTKCRLASINVRLSTFLVAYLVCSLLVYLNSKVRIEVFEMVMSFEPNTIKTYGWPFVLYEHHFFDAGSGKIFLDGDSISWIGLMGNVFIGIFFTLISMIGVEHLCVRLKKRTPGQT